VVAVLQKPFETEDLLDLLKRHAGEQTEIAR
jgi:hypothetical protein